jgi:hypothetical protein
MNSNTVIRSARSLALLAVALAATALCCSCANRTGGNSYVQDRVNTVRGLTVPSDAAAIKNSGPTLSVYLARAHWDFETNEERKMYLSWVAQQLERDDFKLQTSDESSRSLAKSSRGEEENVDIKVTPTDRSFHVQVAYTIDSD